MTAEGVSILSIIVNFILGVVKLFLGFISGSIALTADGIHSSLDVFSSLITYIGFKIAKKPIDEKHPYGHWKAESLAGFLVSILLALTGFWILYEASERFFGAKTASFSLTAIITVAVCALICEILARIKFYYGEKSNSLSLIADAEHSRADGLSSVGVLIGLLLIPYFSYADAIIALGIGVYILFEAFKIGKEITESLLDVANKDIEERIKKICQTHKIEISDIKTRKIGSFNSAEIKINLPKKLKVEEVEKITNILEDRLKKNIPELKQIVISIKAYDMRRVVILPRLGKEIGKLEGFEKIGPEKKGERIILPLEERKLSSYFGAKEYLIIDIEKGKITREEKMKNPYFETDSPRGARFAKAIRADEIVVKQIGPNAKQNLENFGIKVKIVEDNKSIEDVKEDILKNINKDEKEN